MGLSNGYINDLVGGTKNKNPKKIIEALCKTYSISPIWFFDESVGMNGEKLENAIKQESELIKAIRKTEKDNEARLSKVESRIFSLEAFLGLANYLPEHYIVESGPKYDEEAEETEKIVKMVTAKNFIEIKNRLSALESILGKKKPYPETTTGNDGPVYSAQSKPEYLHAAEPAAAYGEEDEECEQIPYVWDIAAGPPIAIDEDRNETVAVPSRLLGKDGRYYAATVRGGSMVEAGIRDGDLVLIRCADVPRDGAVQVVRYQDKSTLKRLREVEGKGWELHYQDGTGRVIFCDSNEYQTQGEFEAILPKSTAPRTR